MTDTLGAAPTAPQARHDHRDDSGRFRERTLAEQHGAVLAELLDRRKAKDARVMAALGGRVGDPLAGRVETTATAPDTGAGYQPQPRRRRTPEESLREHGDLLVGLRDQKDARSPFGSLAQF